MTKEQFIKRIKKEHPNLYNQYDFSLLPDIVLGKRKIDVICMEHGLFTIYTNNMLYTGRGCPKCGRARRVMSAGEFIKRSIAIYGNDFNYNKVEFVDTRTPVTLQCNKCGYIFDRLPSLHLSRKLECKRCVSKTNGVKRRISNKEYIEKAKYIHGDKYDYSKTVYSTMVSKITVICKIHGDFKVNAYDHVHHKAGCNKCGYISSSIKQSLGTAKFIERSIAMYGDAYDYYKVKYKNARTKITLICKKHGEFTVTPDRHLNQNIGCPLCVNVINRKENGVMTKEKYLEKMKDRQPDFLDKYKYDRLPNSFTVGSKIEVGCPIHGYWKLKANDHLYQGNGCKPCRYKQGRPRKVHDTESFIKEAKEIHGNHYKYEKVDYVNAKTRVTVTCKLHGDFEITPDKHINSKRGCPLCGIKKCDDSRRSNTEEFVEKCKKIYHKFNYDYSRVNYVRARDKVEIICRREGHGSFWVTPDYMLNNKQLKEGKVYTKCPKCMGSAVERQITELLIRHKQLFTREYKIKGYNYRFDFYLPYYHHFHEHHGWFGHYENIPKAELKWITKEGHKKRLQRDKEKRELIKKVGGTLTVTYNSDYEESQVEYKVIKMLRDCIKRKYHSDKKLQERYALEKLYEESMVDDSSIKRLYGLENL